MGFLNKGGALILSFGLNKEVPELTKQKMQKSITWKPGYTKQLGSMPKKC